MNDAPRRWWNILDKALWFYGRFPHELIDAVMCCPQCIRVSEAENKVTMHSGTIQATFQTNRVRGQKQMLHMIECWIPLQEVQLQENPWQKLSIFLQMIFFGTGGTEMEQRVPARLRKNFQVGSEDWNDVTFTGQRIRWTKDSQSGSCIEVSKQKALMN